MCSRPAHAQADWEQQTLGVAVQLLDVSVLIAHIVCCTFAAVIMDSCLLLNVQTLEQLHMKAYVCHLDLTITNVMLQDDRSNGWDVLRLIDFGFAQVFNEGKLVSPQSMLQGFRSKHLPDLFLLLLQQCRPMSLSDKEHHGYALHCPTAHQQVKLIACTVCIALSKCLVCLQTCCTLVSARGMSSQQVQPLPMQPQSCCVPFSVSGRVLKTMMSLS